MCAWVPWSVGSVRRPSTRPCMHARDASRAVGLSRSCMEDIGGRGRRRRLAAHMPVYICMRTCVCVCVLAHGETCYLPRLLASARRETEKRNARTVRICQLELAASCSMRGARALNASLLLSLRWCTAQSFCPHTGFFPIYGSARSFLSFCRAFTASQLCARSRTRWSKLRVSQKFTRPRYSRKTAAILSYFPLSLTCQFLSLL